MKPQSCTDSSGSLLAKQTARILCWWASRVFCFPIASPVAATVYYRDGNGAAADAGPAPTGTWGTSAFLSTNASGLTATANSATTALDQLIFSVGTVSCNWSPIPVPRVISGSICADVGTFIAQAETPWRQCKLQKGGIM